MLLLLLPLQLLALQQVPVMPPCLLVLVLVLVGAGKSHSEATAALPWWMWRRCPLHHCP
jgi:hypothetical protein